MKRSLLILSVTIAVLLCACTGTVSQSIESSPSAASQTSSAVTSTSTSGTAAPEQSQEAVTLAENAGIELEDITDITEGFEAVGLFQNGYAVAVKDGEVGYMNLEGEYQPLYSISMDELVFSPMITPLIPFYSGGQDDKIAIAKFLHSKLACSEDGIVPYYANGKWGYSDVKGNVIVEPVYDYVEPFGKNYGVAYRLKADGETYPTPLNLEMIDKNGNVVATSENSLHCNDNEGVYCVYEEASEQQLGAGNLQLYNVQGKLLYEGTADGMDNYGYGSTDLKLCFEGYRVFNTETLLYDLYDYNGNQLASGIEKEVTNVNKDGWFFYTENEKYGLGNESNPEFATGLDNCLFNADGTIWTQKNGVVTAYDSEGNMIEADVVFASQPMSQPTGDELRGDPIVITDVQGQEVAQVSTDFSSASNSIYWAFYEAEKVEQKNGLCVLHNGELKFYRLNFTN